MTFSASETHSATREEVAIGWALRHTHGDMSFTEIEVFAAWLGEDTANGEAFDEAMAAWHMLDGPSFEPEMLSLRCEALGALQAAQRRRWRPSPVWRSAALAASLVLGLSIGIYLWNAPDHYRTGVGERRVVALADGSRVTLDAKSSVTVSYHAHTRELTLDSGRATFSVAKDPLRPFSVASHDSMVIATGTQFSVERLGEATRVVLYEGHVAVMRKLGDRLVPATLSSRHGDSPADTELTPGRELILPDNAVPSRLRTLPDPDAERAWEHGQIDVDDEPLGIAAARMNRYQTGPRLIVAPEITDIRVSGLFDAGDIEAFASGIAGIAPVDAERRVDGSFYLHRRSSSTSKKR